MLRKLIVLRLKGMRLKSFWVKEESLRLKRERQKLLVREKESTEVSFLRLN